MIPAEKAQEDAYFYRINRELIRQYHSDTVEHITIYRKDVTPVSSSQKWSLYDFLNKHLQPDEKWIADL